MAASLISNRVLKVFPSHLLEVGQVQGNGHFQISKAISTDINAGWTGGHSRQDAPWCVGTSWLIGRVT